MKRLNSVIVFAFSIMALSPTSLLAMDDDALLQDADSFLQSEKIDVDGRWAEKTSEEPDEKSVDEIIEEARQISEKRNVDKIAKKIKKIKVPAKQVRKITNGEKGKLQKRIGEFFQTDEGQAVAVNAIQGATSVSSAKVTRRKKSFVNDVKVIANGGGQFISGDNISFESNFLAGVGVEAKVGNRFAIAANFSYSSLDLKDLDSLWNTNNYTSNYSNYYNGYNNAYYSNYGTFNNYNNYNNFNTNYTSTFGSARELEYSHMTIGMDGKFMILPDSMINPFVGLGVNVNRVSLKYADDGTSYTDSYLSVSYGNENYSSTYIGAAILGGVEINFTETFGMILEGRYSKGLTGSSESSYVSNYDQYRMNEIGEMIKESSFMSMTVGMSVTF